MIKDTVKSSGRGRRSRFPALEKQRIVQEADEQGSSVSYVARQYGVSPC